MLERFTVIDLVQTRSASVANVSGNYIKFNLQTAAELGYPSFVQFLYLEKKQQFGIRACKEDASHLGLPIPTKIKDVLKQLHDRAEEDGDYQ